MTPIFAFAWIRRWSRNHRWITGSSWEPNEDKSSWGCTLYKPTIVDEEAGKAKKIRLLHVQLEHYVLLKKINRYPFEDCLLAGSKEIDADSSSPCDVLTVVDWNSIYKVPKHVALKGDNGLYLGATLLDDDKPCLAFLYEDPKDPKVGQQIIHFPDGSAYVKSDYYGKYWRVGEQDYMTVDADEPTGSKKDGSVLFRLTMVDVNVIALMNMTRIQFVKRYTIGDSDSFLCANTQFIDMWAKLQVTDLDN